MNKRNSIADSGKKFFQQTGLGLAFFCLLVQMLPLFFLSSNPSYNENNLSHITFSFKKENSKCNFLKDFVLCYCIEEDEENRLEKSKKQKDFLPLFISPYHIPYANIYLQPETAFESVYKETPLYLFYHSWKIGLQPIAA